MAKIVLMLTNGFVNIEFIQTFHLTKLASNICCPHVRTIIML